MGGFVHLKDVIFAGGFTLGILALLSVYSLALIWERWRYHKKTLGGLPRFIESLRHTLQADDMRAALALCKHAPGPAANVVAACLVGPTGKDERGNATDRALGREIAALEKGLPFLGTIGSTAPFIGLFGTVLGVMRAFRDLAGAANAGPGVVAVGISEALIATAAGLFVAIPAIIAYNYFTTKSNRFSEEMRWVTEEILDRLTESSAR